MIANKVCVDPEQESVPLKLDAYIYVSLLNWTELSIK